MGWLRRRKELTAYTQKKAVEKSLHRTTYRLQKALSKAKEAGAEAQNLTERMKRLDPQTQLRAIAEAANKLSQGLTAVPEGAGVREAVPAGAVASPAVQEPTLELLARVHASLVNRGVSSELANEALLDATQGGSGFHPQLANTVAYPLAPVGGWDAPPSTPTHRMPYGPLPPIAPVSVQPHGGPLPYNWAGAQQGGVASPSPPHVMRSNANAAPMPFPLAPAVSLEDMKQMVAQSFVVGYLDPERRPAAEQYFDKIWREAPEWLPSREQMQAAFRAKGVEPSPALLDVLYPRVAEASRSVTYGGQVPTDKQQSASPRGSGVLQGQQIILDGASITPNAVPNAVLGQGSIPASPGLAGYPPPASLPITRTGPASHAAPSPA